MTNKYTKPVTRKGWDENNSAYATVWKTPFRRWLSAQEERFIKNALDKYADASGLYYKDILVLDIGSGTGRILDIYLRNNNVKQIYSVDYSAKMVNYLKSKYKNSINVKVNDISKNPPGFNRKFNFASSIRVIKYSDSLDKSIKNVSIIMKKDAYFVFTIPNKHSLAYFSGDKWIMVSYSEVKKVLEKHDLEIIDTGGFIRIPDRFYDIQYLYKFNVFIETMFSKILKNHLFSREMFVLCRKTS